MSSDLRVVTGAPGSGKSAVVEALLAADSEFVVLDIDWIVDAACDLANRDIYSDPSTWKPYGQLWFEVLHSIVRNDLVPIFFCPNMPSDLATQGIPDWCGTVFWLLLDCDDTTRLGRLDARPDWSIAEKSEALEDAKALRLAIGQSIDTGALSPGEVAEKVLGWAKSVSAGT